MKMYSRVAVLVAGLCVAACAGDASEEKTADTAPILPQVDSIASDPRGADTVPEPVNPATIPVTTAGIEVTEGKMTMSHKFIRGGRVTIAIENKGKKNHIVEIRAINGTWRTAPIGPGSYTVLEINVDKGKYQAFCTVEEGGKAHKDQGEKVEFEVKPIVE